MRHPAIIFCDFDGTITDTDTLSDLLNHINPGGAERYVNGLKQGEITLSQALKGLFALIPSRRSDEIERYIGQVRVREGFDDFLDFVSRAGIPFVLLSGGLMPMVEGVAGRWFPKMMGVYAAQLDLSGETMRFHSPWENESEMVDKRKVMALYRYDRAVCIGDGITDVWMAKNSDLVFARDQLADILEKEGRTYHPWNNFYDIIRGLERELIPQLKGEGCND